MNVYIVGTTIELTVSFADEDGNPIDPAGVTGSMMTPDRVTAPLVGIARNSLGNWSAPYTPTQNGLHQYRFVGAGTHASADEQSFIAQTVFV